MGPTVKLLADWSELNNCVETKLYGLPLFWFWCLEGVCCSRWRLSSWSCAPVSAILLCSKPDTQKTSCNGNTPSSHHASLSLSSRWPPFLCLSFVHAPTHPPTHTHIIHKHTHACMHTHTCKHTHARTHARTHTHTHTHTRNNKKTPKKTHKHRHTHAT